MRVLSACCAGGHSGARISLRDESASVDGSWSSIAGKGAKDVTRTRSIVIVVSRLVLVARQALSFDAHSTHTHTPSLSQSYQTLCLTSLRNLTSRFLS